MYVSQSMFLFLLLLVLPNIRQSSAQVGHREQQQIVNRHNEIRHAIMYGRVGKQPPGIGLKEMEYDHALAQKAQEIADTHRCNHQGVTDRRWPYIGQNIHIRMSSVQECPQNWMEAINSWYNEHTNYQYPHPSRSPLKKTDHYTQLVWADTYAVGCGYSCFEENGLYNQCYICNYAPGGNIQGQPPYQRA